LDEKTKEIVERLRRGSHATWDGERLTDFRPSSSDITEAADIISRCGGTTTMGRALAETYARDPSFYSGTFCCTCGKHFPVGEDGEFVWDDGSKVGR
jgi:hypothetical protein